MSATLWLLRHGDTDWAAAERHTGRRDVPLNEQGRRQAQAAGRRLAGRRFGRVFVSPQARARQTAELAGASEGATLLDALVEWDYGDYEGLTDAETQQRAPGWDLFRDGCPNGESPAQVAERIATVLAAVREPEGDCLLVSHGKLLRALTGEWLGAGMELGATLALSPAAVSVLGRENGLPQLRRWNLPPDGQL